MSATSVLTPIGVNTLPMQQALRVALARLDDFPALDTREDVGRAAAGVAPPTSQIVGFTAVSGQKAAR